MDISQPKVLANSIKQNQGVFSDAYLEEAMTMPSGTEPGLMYPGGKMGLHLRDDLSAELYAGQARLLLYRPEAAALLMAAQITLMASELILGAGDITKLSFLGRHLSTKWWDGTWEAIYPGKDPIGGVGLDQAQFVMGQADPTKGQHNATGSLLFPHSKVFEKSEMSDVDLERLNVLSNAVKDIQGGGCFG